MTGFQRRFGRDALWGYLFVAPQVIGLLCFVLIPMVASLLLSFSRYDLGEPRAWIGFENYRTLVDDSLFWKVLKNTVVYTVGTISLTVVLALLIANGLNANIRFATVYRAIYFLPSVTSAVAIALVWAWLYNPDFGLINLALDQLGIRGPAWTASVDWAMPSLIIVSAWAGLGYNAVIFLAGLKSIPKEFYEAAKIDGANGWQRYWDITLPMLSPTIFFVLVVATIGSFQVFNIVYLLTAGGPADSTNVLVKYLFDVGFRFFRLGEAAAIAWVLFLIVAVLSAVQFRFSRWVHYE
ncbi:MAG: carbohydrate ABC transporter permease [Thermomicrobiales bacterium]